jgi:SAM-dependent methyltransferase
MTDEKTNPISDAFEKSFLNIPLDQQVRNCEHYELASLFRRVLPRHQPVLEAGCGSGRWVAWMLNQGWNAAGIDWSEALCQRAREAIPGGTFVCGDMRAMPFKDGEFGSVLSLGAVEHAEEGPLPVLREYRRVLRPAGVAIITVPHLGLVRRMKRIIKEFVRPILYVLTLRRDRLRNLRAVGRASNRSWAPDFLRKGERWSFFQYNFTKRQMRSFLDEAGFERLEEFVDFRDEGILHNFGRLAGTYDAQNSRVVFSPAGRFLQALISMNLLGHMLCYVVRKP